MVSLLLATVSTIVPLVAKVALALTVVPRHLDLLVVLLKMKRLFELYMLNMKQIQNGSL